MEGVVLLFKLGSLLLFITFTQIIGVLITMQFFLGKSDELLLHTPSLVILIIIAELVYSLLLIYKGYTKLKK
jgi:hypothetical protein